MRKKYTLEQIAARVIAMKFATSISETDIDSMSRYILLFSDLGYSLAIEGREDFHLIKIFGAAAVEIYDFSGGKNKIARTFYQDDLALWLGKSAERSKYNFDHGILDGKFGFIYTEGHYVVEVRSIPLV